MWPRKKRSSFHVECFINEATMIDCVICEIPSDPIKAKQSDLVEKIVSLCFFPTAKA
jgi:hypothetical protein